MTSDEASKLKPKTQKAINLTVEEELLNNHLSKVSKHWKTLLSEVTDNGSSSLLLKHINVYTTKNLSDYFIHKNLEGFLRKELDRYVNNEIIVTRDILNSGSVSNLDTVLQLGKTVQKVASNVITILSQIENFQISLWLKKKFVKKTNYCITLDLVPESMYQEITKNKSQFDEWQNIYSLSKINYHNNNSKASYPLPVDFLRKNKYLMLDTKHYDESFKIKLLSKISVKKPLSDVIDGTIVKGDNFQAIRLLKETYKEKISCIHLDPPYNTDTSGFLYKNDYRHSSWLTMMENRISESLSMIDKTGYLMVHVDENEYERLRMLFEHFMIPVVGTVIWDKTMPMMGGNKIAKQHEYIIFASHSQSKLQTRETGYPAMLDKAKEICLKHLEVDERNKKFKQWVNNNKLLSENEKLYNKIDEKGRVYRCVTLGATDNRTIAHFRKPLIHPVTQKACVMPSKGFSKKEATIKELLKNNLVEFGKDETTQPQEKKILSYDMKPQLQSIIRDSSRGLPELSQLNLPSFPFNHSYKFYKKLINYAMLNDYGNVLDYYGGSGTTGHAVIETNRIYGTKFKYILIEMGNQTDEILIPRLKKVVYTNEWKNGVPENDEGISHAFKYFEIESYEDVLNNLEESPKKTLFDSHEYKNMHNDYVLKYMLQSDIETTVGINCTNFEDPFNFTVKQYRQGNEQQVKIDLVETFNYLIGFEENQRFAGSNIMALKGKCNNGQKVLILWRNIKTVTTDALYEWYKYNIEKSCREVDIIYVNGDNAFKGKLNTPNMLVQVIEPVFKKSMFANDIGI